VRNSNGDRRKNDDKKKKKKSFCFCRFSSFGVLRVRDLLLRPATNRGTRRAQRRGASSANVDRRVKANYFFSLFFFFIIEKTFFLLSLT
jgi:hypothetical protein